MTDPIDEFKEILKKTQPPAVNKIVENQSIETAMKKFDQKNVHVRQGSGWWGRLTGTARSVLHLNDGVSMKTAYKIGGGLCAATFAIALLNSSALNNEFHQFTQTQGIKDSQDANSKGSLSPNVKQQAATLMQSPALPTATPAPVALNMLPATAIGAPPPPSAVVLPDMASIPSAAPRSDVAKVKIAPGSENAFAEARSGSPAGAGADGMARVRVPAEASRASMKGVSSQQDMPQNYYHDEGHDKFEHAQDNPVKLVTQEPVSTFSIDVDSSSYSFIRATLNQNALPQKDAVRIEEMVNYFPYDYAAPKDRTEPFSTSVNVMPTPWNKDTKLIHIGIKGYDIPRDAKPHSNLVFLIDTSGSMDEPNKMPLLKNSLKLLLDSLKPEDTVAIVTYAGNAGVALEPTPVRDKSRILSTIENFNAGGSTAGAEGIRKAYELAKQNFDKHGVNRVILATDGDFNVGITDQNELKSYITHERESGVFLSVLGFGMSNYNDAMMQTLAQNGNGNAAYIDNLNEARKVLVEEAGSTLFTIAKDVKIQVEFNPAKVSEYRLIGYETRMLNREDFNNDKIDAGEIGSGHTVTAIYEITPAGNTGSVDPLRYASETKEQTKRASNEYAFLKIRYKLPKEETSKLITTTIDAHQEVSSIDKASTDARFATSVAAFGQLLRDEGKTKDFSYNDIITMAQSAKGPDNFGYRAEFINLVRLAKAAALRSMPAEQQSPRLPD